MGDGREVHKTLGSVEAVSFEPVRAGDGSIDVEASVVMLDERFASESLLYRLSPFRRTKRATLRAGLNQLER